MFNPILEYRPLPHHVFDQVLHFQHLKAQQFFPQRMQLLNRIKQELAEYTGQDFLISVDPFMNTVSYNHQAVIGFSDLGGNEGSVIFWLAHEWGHLIHQDSMGRPHVPADIKEQQADIFAATFMRKKGYAIEGILDTLRIMPQPQDPMDEHGQTDERMRRIYHAYLGYPQQFPAQYAQPHPHVAHLEPRRQPQLYSHQPTHVQKSRLQPTQTHTFALQRDTFKVTC